MNNFAMMKTIITQFSGKDNTIAVNAAYCRYVGNDLEIGAFLSQLVYWSDKSHRKDGFFYKTASEWEKEIFMSEYKIRKATKRLEELGILETKKIKANGSPTIHFRVNMEKFINDFGEFLLKERETLAEKNAETLENSGNLKIKEWKPKNLSLETEKFKFGNLKIKESLTEITTETTTSIKNNKKILSGNQTSPSVDSKIPFVEIIDYLNKKANKNFKYGDEHKKFIRARWKEGYTLEDFKHVIDVKVLDWLNDSKWNEYLRPKTLFNADNFSGYLNKKIITKPKNNSNDFNLEDFM